MRDLFKIWEIFCFEYQLQAVQTYHGAYVRIFDLIQRSCKKTFPASGGSVQAGNVVGDGLDLAVI